MKQKRLELTATHVTFQQCLEAARKIMTQAGQHAANELGEAPPHLVETTLLDGSIRIVAEWPDGEQTNECIVKSMANEQGFSA